MEGWIGAAIPEMAKQDAQVALLRRWLHAFGPATEMDIRWWTGWAATQVRAALAAIGAVEVEIDGGHGHVLPDDVEPADPVDPWVALLPSLDPTTMGWKERDWYLGPHRDVLFDQNGNAGQTVWVDGRIVGGWGQRPDGEITWELLEDVGSDARSEIERHASRLRDWIGVTKVTPRFRSPMDRRLGS